LATTLRDRRTGSGDVRLRQVVSFNGLDKMRVYEIEPRRGSPWPEKPSLTWSNLNGSCNRDYQQIDLTDRKIVVRTTIRVILRNSSSSEVFDYLTASEAILDISRSCHSKICHLNIAIRWTLVRSNLVEVRIEYLYTLFLSSRRGSEIMRNQSEYSCASILEVPRSSSS